MIPRDERGSLALLALTSPLAVFLCLFFFFLLITFVHFDHLFSPGPSPLWEPLSAQ